MDSRISLPQETESPHYPNNMGKIPLDHQAFFIALWLETLFYGFHVVLFVFCLFILLRHKRPGYAVFLVTAIFIFAFSTVHIFAVFVEFLQHYWSRFQTDPHEHHKNMLKLSLKFASQNREQAGKDKHDRWPIVVSPKTFAYVMNGFFADALVVYRCYAIWNFDTYYILPAAVLVLVTAMVGVSTIEEKPRAIQPSQAFFILSLITNLYATAMAAGRLYYLLPAVREYWGNLPDLQRRLRRAFIIILETGAINAACFIVFLVLCQSHDTEGAALLVQQCVAQIFGIIPTSIIVIVGLGFESEFKPNRQSKSYRSHQYIESLLSHHTSSPSRRFV